MTPQMFDEAARETFLVHIRAGMRPGAAAEALAIARPVALGYIHDHPEFAMRVLDAEDEAIEHIEEAIYQSGVSGNFPAAKLWLELTKEKRERARKGQSQLAEQAMEGVTSIPERDSDEFDEFLRDLED
jgi:hypothetical protein